MKKPVKQGFGLFV